MKGDHHARDAGDRQALILFVGMAALAIAVTLLLTGCSVDVNGTLGHLDCRAVIIQEYHAAPADCGMLWIENPSGETWLMKDHECERLTCVTMAPGEVAFGATRSTEAVADDMKMRVADCSEVCP